MNPNIGTASDPHLDAMKAVAVDLTDLPKTTPVEAPAALDAKALVEEVVHALTTPSQTPRRTWKTPDLSALQAGVDAFEPPTTEDEGHTEADEHEDVDEVEVDDVEVEEPDFAIGLFAKIAHSRRQSRLAATEQDIAFYEGQAELATAGADPDPGPVTWKKLNRVQRNQLVYDALEAGTPTDEHHHGAGHATETTPARTRAQKRFAATVSSNTHALHSTAREAAILTSARETMPNAPYVRVTKSWLRSQRKALKTALKNGDIDRATYDHELHELPHHASSSFHGVTRHRAEGEATTHKPDKPERTAVATHSIRGENQSILAGTAHNRAESARAEAARQRGEITTKLEKAEARHARWQTRKTNAGEGIKAKARATREGVRNLGQRVMSRGTDEAAEEPTDDGSDVS